MSSNKSLFERTREQFLAVNSGKYNPTERRLSLIDHLKSLPEPEARDPFFQLCWAVGEGNPIVVGRIIQEDSEKSVVNSQEPITGLTALHYASDAGDYAIAEALLQGGAEVNATDVLGNTALHYASYSGNETIVSELLKRGASVDARDTDGNTALHCAAVSGCEAIVEKLLQQGAEVDAMNEEMSRPIHYALGLGFREVFVSLLKYKADISEIVQQPVSGAGSEWID